MGLYLLGQFLLLTPYRERSHCAVNKSQSLETLILAIFGQILAMKPPIFANFFGFSLKKKKNCWNPRGFQKNRQKNQGVSKKLSFSRFAKENPILKCKILHFKMGFSFANFEKYSFFDTPPWKRNYTITGQF